MENPYHYFDNFVLRTPILNLDFYMKLTSGKTVSDQELKIVFSDPIIQESIFLASPALYKEINKWTAGKLDKKKELRLKNSFLKYITRMSTKCVPFGLFAGCSLGKIDEKTDIEMNSDTFKWRNTRLDMNYLVALAKDLARNENIKKQVLFFPNSSIYQSGNKIRYVEYYIIDGFRRHCIVEVDNSKYLQMILNISKNGATIKDISQNLINNDISKEEALFFINELIEAQLLVSELEPSVSGTEFMNQIKNVLKKLEGTEKEIVFLERIENKLNVLDNNFGNKISTYINLSNFLKEYPTTFKLKYLFQTDMGIQPKKNLLSRNVVTSIKRGMAVLNKLTVEYENSRLNDFKIQFLERYEGREMSLSKVLDVETGIGYGEDSDNGVINPLIDDIILPDQSELIKTSSSRQSPIYELLEKYLISCDQNNESIIQLRDFDLKDFPSNWKDLPDSFSTMVEIIKEGEIEKIKLTGMGGSSAANMLARFCQNDKGLNQFAEKIIDIEKRINEDKVLAEVVHLPEARVGNILMRPSFRDYEIPYLAKSNLEPIKQITIDDLYVSIKNDKIVLRASKLNKEVIPHITNAHNYSDSPLPIYRFLGDIQYQNGRPGVYFDYGILSHNRSFLPRVEYDNIILHLAKWKVNKIDIQKIISSSTKDDITIKKMDNWRNKIKLPQLVLLNNGENDLLINFSNLSSVKMLLDAVKHQSNFLLSEFLFSSKSILGSTSISHTHQIHISFYNKSKLKSIKKYDN
ncbi:lantibiotic dehydratase family protein [Joostella atrarenae]|uniref:Lantibiotic dehydratase family protein n=1 Tax=Joostella atrarenae TaxID=679257 RepID=A0ABS9J7F1_9FLAO|nr:lantibiotic dehydratase family protein [Joostella atrarenae]MCF8716358.1 lantibiotic dehydratase family protein [Joostella atrarenae]